MSGDRIPFPALDPEGVMDGDYVVSVVGGNVTGLTAASSGGAGSLAVEDDGTEILAAASRLNFTGAGVAVTDDGAGGANVAIAGGSSGGASALAGLTDVDLTTDPPEDLEALLYDAATDKWVSGPHGQVLLGWSDIDVAATATMERNSTSSGTFAKSSWDVVFETDVELTAVKFDSFAASTYTLSVNAVNKGSVVATAGQSNATVTLATPLTLAAGIPHRFALTPTSAVRWNYRLGSANAANLGGDGAAFINSWSDWIEVAGATVHARLFFEHPALEPVQLPFVLLENGTTTPPATTPVGAIGFRKATPGSTNSGKSIGWWDGATWQPLE